MLDKELEENQDSPSSPSSPVTPSLQPARATPYEHPTLIGSHGGPRRGAGRPKGSPNKVTSTLRDVLLQAVSEVGDSRVEGVEKPIDVTP